MSENLEKLDLEAQESLDGTMSFIEEEYIKIKFQCGPIKEHDENGTTIELVAQVLIDRLEGFQKGPFKCRENALAITKFQEAIHWLEDRTKGRQDRGVEGTNKA